MKINAALRLILTAKGPAGQSQMKTTKPPPLVDKKPGRPKGAGPDKQYKVNAPDKEYKLNDGWFKALTDKQQEKYVKEHPDSKYAKDWRRKPKHTEPPKYAPKETPDGKARKDWKPEPDDFEEGYNEDEDVDFGNVAKPDETWPKPQSKKTPVKKPEPPVLRDKIPHGGSPKAQEALKKTPRAVQKFVETKQTQAGSKMRSAVARSVKKNAPRIAKGILRDNVGLAKSLMLFPRILKDKGSFSDFKSVGKLGLTILASTAMAGALGTTGPVGFLAFMALKHLGLKPLGRLVMHAVGIDSDEEEDVKPKKRSPYKKPASHTLQRRRHASVITAAEENAEAEKILTRIIEGMADYAESGEITDDAWDASLIEMSQTPEESTTGEVDKETGKGEADLDSNKLENLKKLSSQDV